jgi:DNA-binding NtrC family response regulator
MGRPTLHLSPDATSLLRSHDWPGNVRELKHVMELAAAHVKDGAEVDVDDLALGPAISAAHGAQGLSQPPNEQFLPIESQIRALIRNQMMLALQATKGNQSEAARLLRMPRRTFAMRMKQFEITSTIFRRRSASGQ